ncbi:PAS domain S-box protein [Chamaesiphon sp. VAR_69_metabat_338]|uniref:PAS domain S-box protein n=1 Tax=Chamaesiphon sp. VAR_69_metabat_338 TaxID=2964704 RepID=UPI00286E0FBD|nr:PAS domain S-box protein [Chamaesiphon sp. VAR_69_metabat_338]
MTVEPQPAIVPTSINVSCQKLLSQIPHLAWLMSDRGEILMANQLWSDYVGRSPIEEAQLLGDRSYVRIETTDPTAPKSGNYCGTFSNLLDEADRAGFASAWAGASRLLEPLSMKLRLMSTLGEWEWFQVGLEPDRDRSGAIIWIGTAQRLGGEAAIPGRSQSMQFLEALLNHASDGIVACDVRGRLVLFNRMAQLFHGLPPEPLPPEEWAKYYDLYDADGVRSLTKDEIPLFRALQGEAVISQEMTIAPTNGMARSLLANATAIYSTTGAKLGAVALMRDITEYQQAMTALKLSEGKFRAIFDGVFQFIGLTTPDGTLIEANQTALNFGGITAEQAIGQKFWEVAGWKFSPAVQKQLQAATARAAQGEFFRCKLELTGAGDRAIPIDFSLSPIRNECGEVTMLIPEGRDLSQLDRAESDLQRVERYTARLATALKVAKAGAWYWELLENKLDWTPEFEALFDYEPGSTQKTYPEWAQRIHPDDLHRVESIVQETILGRLPQHRCEYRLVCRDGSIRWVEGIGEIGIDEAGKTYLAGLVRDITDRKCTEEALRRSEEFQQRILASNNDCIKVFDLEGRLIYMNHGGLTLLEIADFAAIANQPWRNLWPGTAIANIEAALATARAGAVGRFEGFCPTATGKPKWWEVVVTPILDANGRVEQILSVSRDITDRHQAALSLQASEELFRHTFEHTPIGFAHATPDGRLTRVNHKFCEIVGYSSTELLAMTFQDLTVPGDLVTELALVDRLFANEIQEYNLEKRYIHKQGHHVWVSLTVSLAREAVADGESLGQPSYFLSAVQDITSRKQLEITNQQQTAELQQLNSSLLLAQQQLKNRNDDLDNFVRVASHDLKAPLRSIANLAEWIEEDTEDRLNNEDRQQFQLLRQRVKRMNALIDGLLRFSRLGRERLATETVDVGQLMAETIDSLAPPPTFEIAILSPLPTLETRCILLGQVLANLLSNAIKHHQRADGRIEIETKDLGDYYQFSIADDGPGIPSGEARERIFEIFQTLKPSSSTENTGIGLALVKKIVEGEGGHIWLADVDVSVGEASRREASQREASAGEHRAVGACFCFTWPKV